MSNEDIRQRAAIAVLPECVRTCNEVLLRGGKLTEETQAKQAAMMAVAYADELAEKLSNLERIGNNWKPANFAKSSKNLQESEDEKIRKWIINEIKIKHHNLDEENVDFVDKAIAWLERQGEHANFLSKIQVGDKVTRNEAGMLVNLSQLKRVAKPSEKQCEQKFEMKTAEESLGIDSDTYNKIVDECIFGKQKSEENKGNIGGISSNWNEVDEELVKWSIHNLTELKDRYGEGYGNVGKCIAWLKSIKDRVQPQPKQEWSEEDEENFCSVYLDVKSARQNTVNSLSGELKEQEQKRMDEVISWLKSLKERIGGKV